MIEVDDLRIDTVGHRVTRGDTPIELSTKEFGVLVALASRAGQVVTKQTLYDEVWGFDQDHRSNVVEVFIRYLRAKVDEPFGVKTIQTVRGAGYRLALPGEAS